MKISSKTGDKGQTSLLSGERVEKYNIRVHTYGTFDEVNSFLGICKSLLKRENPNSSDLNFIEEIQNKLVLVSAETADKENKLKIEKISESDLEKIEAQIEVFENELEMPSKFILPGESETEAYFHVVRTVLRRGERYLTELASQEYIRPILLRYVNRLSDLMFLYSVKYRSKQ